MPLVKQLKTVPWVWNHPANEGARWQSIGRAARFQLRGRVLKKPTLGRIGESARFIAEIGSYSSSRAIYANPPDCPEMLVWQQRLNAGDLFVDVGANIGVYSLWVSGLGAQVIAVEPGPGTVTRLRRNVELNPDLSIDIVEAAMTNHDGVDLFDPSGRTTAGLGQGVEVAALTLDTLLAGRYAAGVKIDVEGSDRLVVEGARQSLAEHRIGCLQIEWNKLSLKVLGETRQPIVDLLQEYGYDLYRPDPTGELQPTDGSFGPDVFAISRSDPSRS